MQATRRGENTQEQKHFSEIHGFFYPIYYFIIFIFYYLLYI